MFKIFKKKDDKEQKFIEEEFNKGNILSPEKRRIENFDELKKASLENEELHKKLLELEVGEELYG